MQKVYEQIKQLDAEVLVVSFAAPAVLAAHLAIAPQPFLVVSDPDRKVYDAFQLGKTRLLAFFRLDVLWHYLRLVFRGWLPGKPKGDGDVWQLGGDFVIDSAGKMVYAHPSGNATDRPTTDELLAALAPSRSP
ncbi:MAG: redoxin domain-containing protein [Planctomycetes bacterium]|nr:redoxin domain-containing protein [Planctomycetota bacterium]